MRSHARSRSQRDSPVGNDVTFELAAVSDRHVWPDQAKGPNLDIRADLRVGMNLRQWGDDRRHASPFDVEAHPCAVAGFASIFQIDQLNGRS